MHTFLDNLQKSGKYSAHKAIHQAELRRAEKIIDQKVLCISDLQIYYLNLENSVIDNDRANFDQSMCSHYGGSYPTEKCFKRKQN